MNLEKFRVWCPDRGQTKADAITLTALDMRDACEQWADHDDRRSAEYSIVSGHDVALVACDSDGNERTFIVSGESVPHYHAKLVVPKSPAKTSANPAALTPTALINPEAVAVTPDHTEKGK